MIASRKQHVLPADRLRAFKTVSRHGLEPNICEGGGGREGGEYDVSIGNKQIINNRIEIMDISNVYTDSIRTRKMYIRILFSIFFF